MIDNPPDLTLLGKIKDGFSSLVLFGVTQQTAIDLKAIITMVIVGALSAFGGSFLSARDTAFELRQHAKLQEEFRVEIRQYMRESSVEIRNLSDRLTRQEIVTATMHQTGMAGMSGMEGGKRK